MNNVIEANNISKAYVDGKFTVEVLKALNLTVVAGEQVAIVGSSGSGKSTLLHLLGGLEKPTDGVVSVMGQDMQGLSASAQGDWRNQHIGFVYQFHHLLAEFSVLENVCMPLLIRGVSLKNARQQALPLLDTVGLTHRLTHKPSELSGGERQRAAIARALITQPAVVLADEPTGNLDADNAAQVYDLLLQLNRDHNTSLVIATHDMLLAERMDRVVRLN